MHDVNLRGKVSFSRGKAKGPIAIECTEIEKGKSFCSQSPSAQNQTPGAGFTRKSLGGGSD